MKRLNASFSWATLALRGWVFCAAFCCTFLPGLASAQWTQTEVDSVVHDTSGAAYSLEQLLRFFRTDVYPPGAVNIPQIPSLLQQIANGQNNYSSDLADILSILADIYSASSSIAGDASDIKGYLSSYLPYLATESTLQNVLSELSALSTISSYLSSWDSSITHLATEQTLQSVLAALQNGDAGSSNVVTALADLQGLLESSTGQVSHVVVDRLPEISVAVTNQNTYDDEWLRFYLTGNQLGENAQTPLFRYAGTGSGSSLVNYNDFDQNLQGFLANAIGQFYWRPTSGSPTFDNAFKYGTANNTAQCLGNRYNLFSIWLAEAMRRLLATNQLVATQIGINRRAITENQSLLLSEFRDAFDDSQASNTVADATSDTETAIDDENEEAQDELDDLYTPEDNTDYVPNVQLEDIGNTQQLLGLGNQSAGNHSAIVTLVHRTRAPGLGGGESGILPPVEIDFGRQSSLVSGLGSFSDFVDYIYAAVFGFMLAIKGLNMWRVCRTASMAAAVGEQPVISLAWKPF